ncbi:MAG TPA: FUSC family protein [Candidatus Acidoferrum sp.]|nr:FUSC family protein [Candidatus Acidoferrum sp.]
MEPVSPLRWFGDFLKEELAPYAERGAVVARAVLAASIVMILTMLFRMPYGAYAALYAVTISRENPQATIKEVKTIVVAFAASVLYVLTGAMLFLGEPDLRLLWIVATLFLMFFALRVVTNHTAAVRFGYLIVVTIPLWDQHISAEGRVEGTLWAFGSISLASIITALTEVAFAEFSGRDDLLQSIAERLGTVKELLECYAEGRPVDSKTEKQITRLAIVGTSRLRRYLKQSSYAPHYAEQMGAVVALTGRLVDIAANLTSLNFDLAGRDREQMGKLATDLTSIRAALLTEHVPSPVETSDNSQRVPHLRELEATVSMIPDVFTRARSVVAYAPQTGGGDPPSRFVVADAFSNPEHLRFALKGCLAASLCYFFYNAKDWPGINTAITTCFLTALSTIGSSHQKQLLRFSGAIIGVVLGIGSQIFILPHLDSIAGFTLLFLAVTIPAVWIATSGPRLSYCGVQILVTFYLINLGEFTVQTSLEPGRDRVIGIFLGLLIMWLVFDQLGGGASAVVEMKRQFVVNLRLLAQFTREPTADDLRLNSERSYVLREKINSNFDAVRASADGVLFEFGPSRQQDLAWRDRFRQWQPSLRLLFVTEIALWKYRARLPGFELPYTVDAAQRAFDDELARTLESMADRIEGRPSQVGFSEESLTRLERAVNTWEGSDPHPATADQFQAFLSLHKRIASLASALQKETGNAV